MLRRTFASPSQGCIRPSPTPRSTIICLMRADETQGCIPIRLPSVRPSRKYRRMPPPETYYPKGKNIVCHRQYHCMPSAVAPYANGKIIACQWRTAGSPVKKQWWRPQPPPLHSIFRPACHRRGRGSFHLSQRDFLHRAADLDDIDTVRQAADAAVCAAIDAHSAGGIYLDHRRRCRAVATLDDYRAVNHLD